MSDRNEMKNPTPINPAQAPVVQEANTMPTTGGKKPEASPDVTSPILYQEPKQQPGAKYTNPTLAVIDTPQPMYTMPAAYPQYTAPVSPMPSTMPVNMQYSMPAAMMQYGMNNTPTPYGMGDTMPYTGYQQNPMSYGCPQAPMYDMQDMQGNMPTVHYDMNAYPLYQYYNPCSYNQLPCPCHGRVDEEEYDDFYGQDDDRRPPFWHYGGFPFGIGFGFGGPQGGYGSPFGLFPFFFI